MISRPPNEEDPVIVISEADLTAAGQQSQQIQSFFDDPAPKPMKPTAVVEAKCGTKGRIYYIVFEKTGSNSWAVQGSIQDLPAVSGTGPARSQVQSKMVSGSIDWTGLKQAGRCPHCSARSIARCGSCNKVTCHPDGKQGSPFRCAWCSHSGVLRGRIKNLSGRAGKGGKKR